MSNTDVLSCDEIMFILQPKGAQRESPTHVTHATQARVFLLKHIPNKKRLEMSFNKVSWFLIQNKKQRRLTGLHVLDRRENIASPVSSLSQATQGQRSHLAAFLGRGSRISLPIRTWGSGLLPGHWWLRASSWRAFLCY